MPHDCDGDKLNVGDEVILRCKITSVFASESSDCNVNLQVYAPIDIPNDITYFPSVTCNSKLVEKRENYDDKVLEEDYIQRIDIIDIT